ncbi:MAG: glycosyltransferase [Chloroflexi bacterium]|nr:glycosyltransferase [Chloroflexota bacterium]
MIAAGKPALAVVVNGGADSIQARRAREIFGRLDHRYRSAILYRSGGRLESVARYALPLAQLRPSLVYWIDVGLATSPVVLGLRPLLGFKLVVEIGDPAFELLRGAGRHPLTCQMARFGDWLVPRVADLVVVRGRHLDPFVRARGARRVVFLPDGVDTDVFRPQDARHLREHLDLGDALVVGVVGSINWSPRYRVCYGWDLIESLAKLRDLPVKGLVVGGGSGLDHLRRRAVELGVANRVAFVGRVPHERVPALVNAMDVCLSTQSNDAVGAGRTTAKLPEYLACGRFVLATDVGEAQAILPEQMRLPYQGVRDDEHPERLAARIRELLVDSSWRAAADERVGLARSLFDYRVLAERVDATIRLALSPASFRGDEEHPPCA